jgi:hypothetical protein
MSSALIRSVSKLTLIFMTEGPFILKFHWIRN